MKQFIEIEHMREQDIQLGNCIRHSNIGGFRVGDLISITEKIDGANASITYEDGQIKAFSSIQELTADQTLRGFYEYAHHLNANIFESNPQYIFFGEWEVPHTVHYNQKTYNCWYVYSIYNKETDCWLPPSTVKLLCKINHLTYIHELYFGKFISWEHCKSFLNCPAYGNQQEGIVVRNCDNLNNFRSNDPFILKIVNKSFKESQKLNHIQKIIDPQKRAQQMKADELAAAIVTPARVQKIINKLIDEDIISDRFEMSMMPIIVKELPKRVFDDCLKEEPEIIAEMGKFASKKISSHAVHIVKQILIGE